MNLTLMIPVRIDSQDRLNNFRMVVPYLLKHVDAKIIITEANDFQRLSNEPFLRSPKILYRFEHLPVGQRFQRTRMLNEMLNLIDTPVVANYDCDVIYDPISYVHSVDHILNHDYDLIYPHPDGMGQLRVHSPKKQENVERFRDSLEIGMLTKLFELQRWKSNQGHCQFFKTSSYRNGFMENENFISWGPEDHERLARFLKLGYMVGHLNHVVYHFEHCASNDSGRGTSTSAANHGLWVKLAGMTKEELVQYYKAQEYLKKYRMI